MAATALRLLKLSLIRGILASLLYFGTYILASWLWEGYSFTNQAFSELSAIGDPMRPLVVPLYLAYSVLLNTFAFGVWQYSRKRVLRFIGGVLAGLGYWALLGCHSRCNCG